MDHMKRVLILAPLCWALSIAAPAEDMPGLDHSVGTTIELAVGALLQTLPLAAQNGGDCQSNIWDCGCYCKPNAGEEIPGNICVEWNDEWNPPLHYQGPYVSCDTDWEPGSTYCQQEHGVNDCVKCEADDTWECDPERLALTGLSLGNPQPLLVMASGGWGWYRVDHQPAPRPSGLVILPCGVRPFATILG